MQFSLKKKTKISTDESVFLMHYHELWREDLKNRSENFFMLYKDFESFLPELTTGALKLYLFFGFSAKNKTGESWYSIDTLADKLGTTARSINTWISELEELELIYRSAENKSSKTTFLIPYTNQILMSDQSINDFMKDYLENPNVKKFMGEINQIYHIFQWRKNQENTKEEIYDKPLNLIAIELLKTYKFRDPKAHTKKTYTIFDLSKYNQFFGEVDYEYMSETTHIFTFDDTYKNEFFNDFKLQGVVINPQFNLLEKKKQQLMEVLEELNETVDFQYYTNVKMNITEEKNDVEEEIN